MAGPGDAFDLSPDMAELRRRLTDLEGKTKRITALETEVTTLKATVAKLGSSTGVPAISAVTVTGVTRHGALTGLDVDDHLQYFNQLRGDARYDKPFTPVSVSANYVGHIDEFVTADATGGTFNVTLPDATDITTKGHRFAVFRLDATANLVAFALAGGNTLNLPSTPIDLTVLVGQYNSVEFVSDGVGTWTPVSYGAVNIAIEIGNTLTVPPWASGLGYDFSATNNFASLSEWQGFILAYMGYLATFRQRIETADTSVNPDVDDVIFFDCSGGNRTVTLPVASAWVVMGGNTFLIRRPVSLCRTDTSGNTLTLAAAGGETVTDLAGTTGATASILVGECWTGTINDGDPTTATGWSPI